MQKNLKGIEDESEKLLIKAYNIQNILRVLK